MDKSEVKLEVSYACFKILTSEAQVMEKSEVQIEVSPS